MNEMTIEYQPPYRQWLVDEFARRKKGNSSYSIRAFARDLGVSHTCVSDLLNFRRHLSKGNIAKIAEALDLSPSEQKSILREISGANHLVKEDFVFYEEDRFRLLSDWYYLAILNIAKLRQNRAEPKWLAKRLGITTAQVVAALDRLTRLGLLKVKRGKLVRTCEPIKTTDDIPSSAIRKFQKQILQLAHKSLDKVPVEKREISTLTLTGSQRKMKKCKELIREFKASLSKFMEGSQGDQVYTFSIQLIPIMEEEKNEIPNSSD